jgi:hypothetical protein
MLKFLAFVLGVLIFCVVDGQSLEEDYFNIRKASYKLAIELDIDTILYDGEKHYWLQFLGPNNHPNYYQLDNVKASKTTSTDLLQSGGGLHLNLSGNGITVGVWDGGQVLNNHEEFAGRTLHQDNSTTVSNHATHVTGTILGSGVNPAAKGMATTAKSKNYDFNGDTPEMSSQAVAGMILSNHSYGLVLGWSQNSENGSWTWFGDAAVSEVEDYRFGLYTNESRNWDQIVYTNPYYLPVKSAGNDRSDVGSGVGAPADGPYDILGPQACSKNILTVGAVTAITNGNYSPSNIGISSFSSWGPTDDGRIKPDIVGMGVGVLSASSSGVDAYATLSGTSMSAPNVTGSLALLQELAFKYNKKYLKAASLKGLVIHTAREAGLNNGPDYIYGWGLLNTAAAAKLLLYRDGSNTILEENSLTSGEQHEVELNLVAGNKVKATIVWSDVPGQAITQAVLDPTQLALVNDLDMRIITPSSNTNLPWRIDPATFQTSKGDNFRDNVEVVEFIATETGVHRLTIGHKGTLTNGKQEYSLIVTSSDIDALGVTYRLVEDNGALVWKNPSGITKNDAEIMPRDRLVVESNISYSLTENISAHSISVIGNNTTFNLNGHSLTLDASLAITGADNSITNGTLQFKGKDVGYVELGNGMLDVDLVFNKQSDLYITNQLNAKSIQIKQGNVSFENCNLSTETFVIDEQYNGVLRLTNTVISGISNLENLSSMTVLTDNLDVQFIGDNSLLDFGNQSTFDKIDVLNNAVLVINSSGLISTMNLDGKLSINSDCSINNLNLGRGVSIDIQNTQTLNITGFITDAVGTESNVIASSSGIGFINSSFANKFCFENTSVSSVHIVGDTKFVIDESTGSIENADGWILGLCQNVLSADFNVTRACIGGVTNFSDLSDGNPTNWIWTFMDNDIEVILTGAEVEYTFTAPGTYLINLKVTNGSDENDYSKSFTVKAADIGVPTIIEEGGMLRSSVFASRYQWFYNQNPIDGATSFSLSNYSEPGEYYIELYSNNCTMRSNNFTVEVTGVIGDTLPFLVYPNPVENNFYILNKDHRFIEHIWIVNMEGKVCLNLNDQSSELVQINVSHLASGLYTLIIEDVQKVKSATRIFIR